MAANGERPAGTPRRWSVQILWKPKRRGTDGLDEVLRPVMQLLRLLDPNGTRRFAVLVRQLNDWPDDDRPVCDDDDSTA